MRHTNLMAAVLVAVTAGTALAQAPTAGFRAEFLGTMAQVESKMMQLADAIPAAKQDWRPTGARSTCEVFMHVAMDKYLFGGPLGLKAPAALQGSNADKCPADKAQAKAMMKSAFAAFNDAVKAMPAAAADEPVTLFGTKTTKRGLLLMTAEHAGEHLGQLIAYARVNNITPPWSK